MSRRRIITAAVVLVVTLISSSAYAATPPEPNSDGTTATYTGTLSGQYQTFNCTGPGIDTGGLVSYSGAIVTLTVANDGNDITLTITHPDFSASGTGSSDGLNLTLSFSPPGANVNITAQNSGKVISIFAPPMPTVSQSGGTVSIGAAVISGIAENCEFNLDWNAFTVLLGSAISSVAPSVLGTVGNVMRIFARIFNETINSRTHSRLHDRNQGAQSGFTKTSSGMTYNLDSGLNAGDWLTTLGAWVNYSYSDFEDEFTATAFDGDRHSFLAGIDYQPTDNSVLGVAFGYEFNDIDTLFNRGEEETDGITIAPYFGLLLTETWSIDFSLGYTNLDTDQFRTAPGTTTIITSEVDGDRWYGALNLNGTWFYDNWVLGARAGALYARTSMEDFVESDGTPRPEIKATLGQLNIGGDVAYSLDEWEPFVRVTYENDFSQTEIPVLGPVQPDFDDDNFLVGFGVRYFNNNGWTGNLEYFKRLGREDFDEDTISLTIRGEF